MREGKSGKGAEFEQARTEHFALELDVPANGSFSPLISSAATGLSKVNKRMMS